MTPHAAHALLESFFAPSSATHFFESISGKVTHALIPAADGYRTSLLGPDPAGAILDAYSRFAGTVRIVGPTDDITTPSDAIIEDRETFERAVRKVHSDNLVVMILNGEEVSSEVVRVRRALEYAVGGPVYVRIFWGQSGSMSRKHRDDSDVLSVQLIGAKSWLISSEDMGFPNPWSEISPGRGGLRACSAKCAESEPHARVTVKEGDLLYVPRGQWHQVHALDQEEAISVAFGFRQTTVRDVLGVMLDYMSDRDREMRAGIGQDEALPAINGSSAPSADALPQIFSRAAAFYGCEANLHDAMQWKRASFLGNLPDLERTGPPDAPVSLASKVRLADLALCFVSMNGSSVVLSYPGDHLTAPAACEPAFRFIVENEEFQIQDLPGRITDRSKLMIAKKLIDCGVLTLCS